MADFGISEIAMGMMAASTAVGVIGTLSGASAQSAQLEQQKQMAEQNARLAKEQAEYNATVKQRTLNQVLGKQKAALAASGVTGGSSEDVEYDSLLQGTLDSLMTKWQGDVQATNYKNQASGFKASASNAMTGGLLSAVGTAIRGAGETYSIYNNATGYGLQPNLYGSNAGRADV